MGALVFVGNALYHSLRDLRGQVASPDFLVAVAVCAILYAVALQLVGLAWYRLLAAAGDVPLGIGQALAIFGRTQIYKYFPSNILHMVGRFAAAKKAGASNAALAFAQVGEVAIIASAAGTVAATFSAPVMSKALARFGIDSTQFATASTGIALLVAAIIIFFTLRLKAMDVGLRATVVAIEAFFLYALFFAGNGLILLTLAYSTGSISLDVWDLMGIGAAAWLIGFVVPGAPGGLGVREAVMIMGLNLAGHPVSSATVIALGHRLVTILGDAIVALCELVIRNLRSAYGVKE
ncbi:hypothetical protein [Rhizobium sp. BK060]|uniref:hypothetical protein n=1 Tax=Rhizobium sp. BK060 TaxID=2587096 RepID=UPI0017D79376|nr:hypothetical protein [Rhizobium sp. BK060]MBB3395045.1 hypothetical protein [Rhizobium sp. BK060]